MRLFGIVTGGMGGMLVAQGARHDAAFTIVLGLAMVGLGVLIGAKSDV